jgi:hypothetical protein
MSNDNSIIPSPKNANYDKAIGLDTMHTMIVDRRIRHVQGYGGEVYLSLVDLMSVFGEDNRQSKSRTTVFNSSKYWNKQKSSILAKDEELSHSVRKLTLPGKDGKFYPTDTAPLWACFFIILLMDTPAATAFKKSVSKGMAFSMGRTIAEVKYRAMNIANGGEWAADYIHNKMIESGLDTKDLFGDPRSDLGY